MLLVLLLFEASVDAEGETNKSCKIELVEVDADPETGLISPGKKLGKMEKGVEEVDGAGDEDVAFALLDDEFCD